MKISVITTVYNGEEYVNEAIDSILSQTYKEFEYFIVNDGSTDHTEQILDNIKDSRVRVVHLKRNEGASKGLNLAVELSAGDWIAIQDADDVSTPERLAKQVEFIKENPNLVAVGSKIKCIAGKKMESVLERMEAVNDYWNKYVFTPEQMRNALLWGCPLCHGSVLFSKAAFKTVAGYTPSLKIAYDWDLWVRLFQIGSVEKIPEILYYYRIHQHSLSHANWLDTCKEMMNISMKYIPALCFGQLHRKLQFIAIGAKEGCMRFEKYVDPQNRWEIMQYFNSSEQLSNNVDEFLRLYEDGAIDGILMLDSPEQDVMINKLEQKGMKLNKNLFKIQSG